MSVLPHFWGITFDCLNYLIIFRSKTKTKRRRFCCESLFEIARLRACLRKNSGLQIATSSRAINIKFNRLILFLRRERVEARRGIKTAAAATWFRHYCDCRGRLWRRLPTYLLQAPSTSPSNFLLGNEGRVVPLRTGLNTPWIQELITTPEEYHAQIKHVEDVSAKAERKLII